MTWREGIKPNYTVGGVHTRNLSDCGECAVVGGRGCSASSLGEHDVSRGTFSARVVAHLQ